MSGTIFLNFSGIVYTLMIMAVFFLKPKTNSTEQKIYGGILVVALFELIIGLFSTYTIYHDTSSFYTNLVGRLFLFTTLAWIALFTIYTINISKKCNQKKLYIFVISSLILSTIMMFILNHPMK